MPRPLGRNIQLVLLDAMFQVCHTEQADCLGLILQSQNYRVAVDDARDRGDIGLRFLL